jgi:hypothetical protein
VFTGYPPCDATCDEAEGYYHGEDGNHAQRKITAQKTSQVTRCFTQSPMLSHG